MAAAIATRPAEIDCGEMTELVRQILRRHPSVGLAFGVVGGGGLEFFHGHGLADIASRSPITEDTVFRIASVTKPFTAIAVMQLWEQGLIDLDAPANEYLRAYRLVPARPGFRPATVRHLLTHTAGIREILHLTDVLRMRDLGETVPAGRHVPTPAEFYRGRLRIDAEPGSRLVYTNHGFTTLGQIIEDVSEMPLARYMRERIFEPLGMPDTELGRSQRLQSRLATAYEFRSDGPRAIPDYDLITSGAGGIYSTPRDMARFLAALLGGGRDVVRPATLAEMFAPQYQTDRRLPGMGLGFFRTEIGDHLALEHSGVLPGFDAQIFLAPDDGVAAMAFANGAAPGFMWLTPELAVVMRRLLGARDEALRDDLPEHPELWGDLCGRYHFATCWTDPARYVVGAGVRVSVRRGRLWMRFLSPIPALYRGSPLHPDDDRDPYVFRIVFPLFGIGTTRVVFSQDAGRGTSALHVDFRTLSFEKR